MANLKAMIAAAAATKQASGSKEYNAFGVVLSVITAEQKNGVLHLVGTVFNNCRSLKRNEEIAVDFRGKSAPKSVSSFKKGGGKLNEPGESAGTLLTLEGCFITKEKDVGGRRVISSRWLNTVATPSKTDEENESHSVMDEVLSRAPCIRFDNPKIDPGEPLTIVLPVNAQIVHAKIPTDDGRSQDKDFPREWALAKLTALDPTAKPWVFNDILEPKLAVAVTDKVGLVAALSEQLARGSNALSLLRVTDGDDVISRGVHVQRTEANEVDVAKTLDLLFAKNIFAGLNNKDLFAGLTDGSFQVEAIPGYRMTWAGVTNTDDNSAFKMIQDVKEGRVQRYELMFGYEGNRYAEVILSGIARNDRVDGFSPINILCDVPGNYLATDFSTPVISRNVPAHSVEVPDGEPAPDFAALEQQFDAALAAGVESSASPRSRP